jgi:hypothetical protein
MNSINSIMQSRSEFFQAQEKLSWKNKIIESADKHLMYGSGACGGYSMVLARTLQVLDYNVRIGQLKTIKNGWSSHIVVEYYSTLLNNWVMIDPLLKYIPKTKNGNMKSIIYLLENWDDLEDQMPIEFRDKFRFSDVRYTNWDKCNGVIKPIFIIAKLFKGKTFADQICLRIYALNAYAILFWIIIGIYFMFLSVIYLSYYKLKKYSD